MFTADDLLWMRAENELHMYDTGIRQIATQGTNTHGETVITYADSGAATACGLDMRPGSERHTNNSTVLTYDATVRLPHDFVITEKDRFKITHRFGEALVTPLVFDVESPVQQGPSGQRYALKKVSV